jgi:hypothetical protein
MGAAMSNAKGSRTGSASRRRMTRRSLDVHARIDDFLRSYVVVNDGESSRRLTCFQVIIEQLWRQSMANSRKATKLLMRCKNFAASFRYKSGVVEVYVLPDPPDEN